MITAKTKSGFEIELEESSLDNMELVDTLDEMNEGNPPCHFPAGPPCCWVKRVKRSCMTTCAPRKAVCPPLQWSVRSSN